MAEAYQVLLKSSVIMTLIPFAYMFAGLMRLDGAGAAVRLAGAVGLTVSVLGAIAAFVPGRDVTSVLVFEAKLVSGVVGPILVGLWLFARSRRHAAAAPAARRRRSGRRGMTCGLMRAPSPTGGGSGPACRTPGMRSRAARRASARRYGLGDAH